MKYIVSKRNTINLTKGKQYLVHQEIKSKHETFRYAITSDRGELIESHVRNFLTLKELRKWKIDNILDH